MVPTSHSNANLSSLSSDDNGKFNSLKLVDISGLENYALNDIALELDHFIDDEIINNLQKEIKVENLKDLWDLSPDYRFTERRNKEIDLVLGELEEKAYRYGGQFTDQEIEGMKRMYKINRGEGIFDQQWLPLDVKEFEDFEFNKFDDRLDILERWFEKKEREIKTRIYLPKEDLNTNAFYASKLKEKTVELMMGMFGKSYGDISTQDLNQFIEGICSRMMLFDGDYPNFLPYIIKEVVNHPNISKIDKEHLESYSDMFDIRWRDDISKPLMISPIYTEDSRKVENDLDSASVSEKMRKANIPYIETLKRSVMEHR
mmetsp:Transcript_30076/g.29577  ORF Transcript_30076/g.29577 Transcript_30076/m.29577 type:complete len:316 (+) Transcript_30076:378-1325(+)